MTLNSRQYETLSIDEILKIEKADTLSAVRHAAVAQAYSNLSIAAAIREQTALIASVPYGTKEEDKGEDDGVDSNN